MAIRISGLVSGLDTDSIVQELVSAYATKKDDIVKKQTKLSWTQDAWKEMNTKIYGFYSKSLTDFKFMSNFNGMKKTTLSDSTKATVTAGPEVTNGTQKLKINQLATAGYMTGSKLQSKGADYTKSSRLGELGISNTELSFEVGGKKKNIEVTSSMTISEFTKALNEAGVSANFDEKQQRFFISSAESGEDFDFGFDITTDAQEAALNKMGLLTADYMVDKAVSESVEKTITETQNKDGVKNRAISELIADGKISAEAEFDTLDDATKQQYLDRALIEEFDLARGGLIAGKDYTDASYITERMSELREDLTAEKTEDLKNSEKYEELKKNYAVKQDASNAIIELNGATFEGSSNTFTINGMTITAKGVTESEMTLVTETDVDAVYDKIKSFIKEYNDLITEMDKAYNADSAKGYEPLTDEEKESMSDKEVEKWEQKIKDSLLRRDSTLDSVASAMKIAMSKSYTINGKTYSLASFGIKTQGYFAAAENEKGVYHIDGDQDDETSKANSDRLKAAIASDPDTVATFFNQLATGVYEQLDAKMKTSTLSSAYKVYNDKQMQEEYDDYTDQIKKWEEKLKEYEEYYYNKFSAMESALSTLNSQQSQLSGLLGM